MYGEFEFALKMTSDPSNPDLDGNVCDLNWFERISRQQNATNIPLNWYIDEQKSVPLGVLVHQSKIVILRSNKDFEIYWSSPGAGPNVVCEVRNNRYAYLVFTAKGASSNLYIDAEAGTRINLVAFGDDL